MLMALLVVAFSMNVTSCKDYDNDEQRRADAEVLDTQEAQTAWRWLCALTNEQTLSDNWAQKTYEPTIGVGAWVCEPSTTDFPYRPPRPPSTSSVSTKLRFGCEMLRGRAEVLKVDKRL